MPLRLSWLVSCCLHFIEQGLTLESFRFSRRQTSRETLRVGDATDAASWQRKRGNDGHNAGKQCPEKDLTSHQLDGGGRSRSRVLGSEDALPTLCRVQDIRKLMALEEDANAILWQPIEIQIEHRQSPADLFFRGAPWEPRRRRVRDLRQTPNNVQAGRQVFGRSDKSYTWRMKEFLLSSVLDRCAVHREGAIS